DEAGQVGHHEAAAHAGTRAVRGDDAQVRLECGEGIVGDFGARRRDAGNQGGFAGVGQADQAHVGQETQFEAQVALLAGLAVFEFARGLVPGFCEVLVAAAAAPAARGQKTDARLGEVEEYFAGIVVVDQRADGNFKQGVGAGLAVAVGAQAVTPGVRAKLAVEAVAQEGVVVGIGNDRDAAALAAVAAGRAAAGHKFLAPEGNAAAAAVSSLHVDAGFVNEHGEWSAVSRKDYDRPKKKPTAGTREG